MAKNLWTLEVCRGKNYRRVYTGKQSQCYKRVQSVKGKYRIRPIF